MANNIGYIEGQMTYNSATATSGEMNVNAGKIREANAKKADLRAQIEASTARLKELGVEADEIANKSGFEKFMGGLFGGDCGAGDVGNATKAESAELKKAANDLKVESTRLEMLLNEINGSQSEMSGRSSDAQKRYDESDQGANL